MKRILMIATGGTIASQSSAAGLKPLISSDKLLSYVPDVRRFCHADTLQLLNIDSTNMQPCHWLKIASAIRSRYDAYDGFVICHGTDTMAYTAAALSYLIQDSEKPIVLTGAQKSILSEITDARKNLHDGIRCVLDERSRDVRVVFDGKIIAGTRAKKTSTFSYDAFSSINFPLIGKIQNDTVLYYIEETVRPKEVKFYGRMDRNVFLWKLTPGVSAKVIPYILREYDCIIMEGFGVGGLPDHLREAFLTEMKQYKAHEKLLVMTTQVTYEGSSMDTYVVGKAAKDELPFLETYDMTLEAVYAKLMWILGLHITSRQEMERLFYQKINHDIMPIHSH